MNYKMPHMLIFTSLFTFHSYFLLAISVRDMSVVIVRKQVLTRTLAFDGVPPEVGCPLEVPILVRSGPG